MLGFLVEEGLSSLSTPFQPGLVLAISIVPHALSRGLSSATGGIILLPALDVGIGFSSVLGPGMISDMSAVEFFLGSQSDRFRPTLLGQTLDLLCTPGALPLLIALGLVTQGSTCIELLLDLALHSGLHCGVILMRRSRFEP